MTSVGSTTFIPVTQADLDEHNIQGLIELVYVRTANEILSSSMASLENALSVTQSVMTTLTSLQQLHNQVSVVSSTFTFNYATGSQGAYNTQASAFFNKPITPTFNLTDGTPSAADFVNNLVAAKNQLASEISNLSAITPPLAGGGVDPNSLLAKLKGVLADLNTAGVSSGNFAAAQSWTLDGYTSTAGGGGQIQQNLTNAVTAGQSLNDTQTQSVRQYLYLFEEYYKSASAVLTKISQLIEKIGQNISK